MSALVSNPLDITEILRVRLIEALGGNRAMSAQLCIIAAPKGFGKTTTLSQWIRQTSAEGADYVRISASRSARGDRFWKRIASAVSNLDDSEAASHSANHHYRSVLAWAEKLESTVTVVVDDYQEVSDASLDAQWVDLLQSAPNLRAVVSGRSFSGLTSPLATARLTTKMITESQLRFTEGEVVELLTTYGGGGISRTRAETERVNGWPVAVDLIGRASVGELKFGDRELGAKDVLYSFLKTDQDRKLAALIAALPGVNVRVLSEALGTHTRNVHSRLRPLLESGLVIRDTVTSQARYSVVPYMEKHLLERMSRFWSAEEIENIQLVHARDLADSHPMKALGLLMDLGYFRSAEDLLAWRLATFLSTSEETLPILRKADAETLGSHPIIAGIRLLLETGEPSQGDAETKWVANEVLRGAQGRLSQVDIDYPVLTQIFLVLALRRVGEWEAAAAQIRDLLPRVRQVEELGLDDSGAVTGLSAFVCGQTTLLAGDLPLAVELFSQSLHDRQEPFSLGVQLHALAGSAVAMALLGNRAEAEKAISLFEERSAGVEMQGVFLTAALTSRRIADAALAHQEGAPSKERAALEELRDHTGEYWPFIALLEVSLVRQEEGPGPALRQLGYRFATEAIRYPISPLLRARVRCALTELVTFCGLYWEAQTALSTAVEKTDCDVNAEARLALFSGEPKKALEILWDNPLRGPLRAARDDRLLLSAVASHQDGQTDAALELFLEFVESIWAGQVFGELSRVPHEAVRQLAVDVRERGHVDLVQQVDEVPPGARVDVRPELSQAQQRILELLVEGMSNAEIAEALPRAENTVKAHLQAIYRKLGVANRREAIVKCARTGMPNRNQWDPVWTAFLTG